MLRVLALLLTYSSFNTFTVTDETTRQVLGTLSFEIGTEDQPTGYIFTSLGGEVHPAKSTILEALRATNEEGDIHIRINPIV
jgi:hypothetical protein